MADSDKPSTLVEGLPQELLDVIWYLTFSPTAQTTTISITTSSKPPTELKVDRTSRDVFATEIYSNVEFVADDMDVVCHWLRQLCGNT